MVVVSHPTGNTFVRALLEALHPLGLLAQFHTTIGISASSVLPSFPSEVRRRAYKLPREKIHAHPLREAVRLIATKLGDAGLTAHARGWASVDNVYKALDRAVARSLRDNSNKDHAITHAYCYEDGALETFRTATALGLKKVYDLPIAYWQTTRKLLLEEAERYPEWEPTLLSTRDSEQKLQRKEDEFKAADLIICPSQFVRQTLPALHPDQRAVVAEFGSPATVAVTRSAKGHGPLRALFAGGMTQRKGLADVFAAMRLLRRSDVELVVAGSAILPLDFYHAQGKFIYESPRAHSDFLTLMSTCDVLVLPSIVEGRALVQQEAMSQGLPLIVTPHAGAEDLIEEGRTGFLIPIRSPEIIAEKLSWFADHRAALPHMAECAQKRAADFTWDSYARKIIEALEMSAAA